MPELRAQIEKEISWIERRLRENREKFEDDIMIGVAEELNLSSEAADDESTAAEDTSEGTSLA
jgi:hypothetical protein